MVELSERGLKVLELLVGILPTVVPGRPETYITYGRAHAILSLPGTAQDLEFQGLGNLAEYASAYELPAISGLVIRQDNYRPGRGYFELYGRDFEDFGWWQEQIEQCKAFDWSDYVTTEAELALEANDLNFPQRVESTILRIVRDTAMARRVKRLHNHTCQICGETVELPDGARYSEAHHIKPLGTPHNGADATDNIICVCPNHHVKLDYFALRLDPKAIIQVPGHIIGPKYIDYNNQQFDELYGESDV